MRQQVLAQIRIDEREEHQSGLLADMFQRTFQLALAADKRVEMFVDGHTFELREGGARNRVQGFAGRVGDQMDMEFPAHRFTLKFVPNRPGSSTTNPLPQINVHSRSKSYSTLGTTRLTLRSLGIFQTLERKRFKP
jgi:hypothetical protein